MKGRQSGRLLVALLVVTALAVAGSAAWLGSQRATANAGASAGASAGGSGILRIGTTSYIDSFNPWNYIEGQGLNAMIMAYPLLVQVDYSKKEGYYITGDWARTWSASKDGKTWTYKLRPNTKWSDGKPMTADDAAWTINTTDQVRRRRDRGPGGPRVNHVVRATAPNPTTLVIRYNAPVGNALWLIQGLPIVPRHIWEPSRRSRRAARRSRRTGPRASSRWSPAAPTRSSNTRRRARRCSSRTRTTTGRSRTPTRSRSPSTRTPTQ